MGEIETAGRVLVTVATCVVAAFAWMFVGVSAARIHLRQEDRGDRGMFVVCGLVGVVMLLLVATS